MTRTDPTALVQAAAVHRDAYLDPAIFDLEQQRLWRRRWVYVGHDSLVPQPGDWQRVRLGADDLLLLRDEAGGLRLLHNRCAHRGAPVLTADAGRGARVLRCPYHGWAYRCDGSLLGIPRGDDYAGSGFDACPAQQGLQAYGELASHRGFVFARADAGGRTFAEEMGAVLALIDLVADRSPVGRLRLAGPPLKTLVRANWKLYLDNIVDAFHPVTTHASVTQSASALHTAGAPLTPALRQLLPFGAGYDFFEHMGARLLPHGHSLLGTQASLHSQAAEVTLHEQALIDAHGAARAREILAFMPQNLVVWPSLALKSSPGVLRVLRPLAVDATVVEAWAFEAEGAPPEQLADALRYNRQVFSPLAMVAHDDLHLFEGQQRALAANCDPWISLHRGAGRGLTDEVSGTDEALLRHQWAAWQAAMRDPA